MKTVASILMILATTLAGAFTAAGSSDDRGLDRRNVRSVELRNVSPRNGKNVALDIAVNPPAGIRLPRGISATINGQQVNLLDDGTWPDSRAGDGVYSVGGATKEPLADKATLRLQSAGRFEPVGSPKVECKFTAVECPANCTSVLFGSKCVVCLKFEGCTVSFF